MEVSLKDICERSEVTMCVVDLLRFELPLLLDDVPEGCRLSADAVMIDVRRCTVRLGELPCGEGNVVVDYGRLLMLALRAAEVKPKVLRRIAEQCIAGEIATPPELRLAVERRAAHSVHAAIVAVMLVLLALLYILFRLQ